MMVTSSVGHMMQIVKFIHAKVWRGVTVAYDVAFKTYLHISNSTSIFYSGLRRMQCI